MKNERKRIKLGLQYVTTVDHNYVLQTKNREVELIIQYKVSLEELKLKLHVTKLLYCTKIRQ